MPTENEIQMLRAARAEGITSREEMSNFMGQMSHESGGFTRLEESFRYTRNIGQIPVVYARREGNEALEAARLEALEGRPQGLARLMYGGRMGNDDVGDGYLYRGRGYTQLTGEENYRNAAAGVNLELVNNPDLAANRTNAQNIALWYWQDRVPQADRDDVSRATVGVNGGIIGLPDRLNRYDTWHTLLTPEFVADLDAGRIRAGAAVLPAADRPAMEDGALRRLETGDEVRQLNDNLRALNIHTDRNRELPAGQTFGPETEQVIRRFQEQQGLPVTGRADPDTLQAVNRAIEQRLHEHPQQHPRQLGPQERAAQDLHQGPPGPEVHDGQDPRNPQHPAQQDQHQRPNPNDRGGIQDPRNPQHPVQPDPHQRPGAPNAPVVPAPFHGALLNDAAHPDNKEFQQIRGLVVPAFAKSGRKPNEEEIDNATAQLLVAKKEDPFVKEVHAVMFSKATDTAQAEKLLHAVYQPHGPDKAPKPQAYVQTDDAMSTPMAQSTQQLNSLNQAQTQQQALAQQQTQTQQQNKEQNQSPVQQMTGGVTMKGPSQA